MRSISGVLLTLFLTPLFSLSHSMPCDSKQCCSKCKPGERLQEYCSASSPTKCVPCGKDHYSDRENLERDCRKCRDCSMLYLEYKRNCTATHNAECGCVRGYRCRSEPCQDCEEIPTPAVDGSTTTTKEVSRNTERGVTPDNQHSEGGVRGAPDAGAESGPASSMWSTHIVLIVCCCAPLIFVILVSRNKNVSQWIWRTAKGFRVDNETATPNQCTEEEEKIPVQEVCEKLEVHSCIYSG